MNFSRFNFEANQLIHFYKTLLKPRLIEEKMLILIRQGEVSKWFSGIGQEAIAVGSTLAMGNQDYILPLHRNLGVFTTRNLPLSKLIAQWQGKKAGYTKGRDRSFHFGSIEHRIIGMISHLGAMLPVADGIALAEKLENTKNAVLVYSGEGGSSEGDFHEALNLASVWNLPVIFLVENNGYGLSTPTSEQFNIQSFTEKAKAYGIEALSIDGNNILEVYTTIQKVRNEIVENPRPFLVEAITFRMRGHEESSGVKYVPPALFEEWSKKDPIHNFEEYLIKTNVISEADVLNIRNEIKNEIEAAWQESRLFPNPSFDINQELNDVYHSTPESFPTLKVQGRKELRYIDAIKEALDQGMELYPNLILMGQDIAAYGGVFKATEGLLEKYGKNRVRNTPICESAIVGSALGLSIKNFKSVVEMQFADFVTCAFNQIVNNLAKNHYRWGHRADCVIRMPTGAGSGAGPFHSQSTESWFFHTPGLKIVFPSNVKDAKGLLLSAIHDPNPVMYFEHKNLYRTLVEEIESEAYFTPIGKASIVKKGTQASIITYGMGVHWALEITKQIDCEADIIDLRTLLPWDKACIKRSIQDTGKAIILTEDTLTGSIASEIAAWIGEECFELLDAPIVRVGSLDTPIPFATELEQTFLPKQRFMEALQKLLAY
jgi:2-oxoisovalerate dehydrogenase E1 component